MKIYGDRRLFLLVQDLTIMVKKNTRSTFTFFSGNLYQKRLRVAFIKKIRDEAKFDSEKAMVQQMDRDCKSVQNILKNKTH